MNESGRITPSGEEVTICMCTPEFPPNHIGGGGIVVMDLVKELRARGLGAYVVSGNYRSRGLLGRGAGDGGNGLTWVSLFPTPNDHPELRTVLPPAPLGLWAQFRAMRRSDADLFHLHGYGHLSVDTAALMCKLLGRPYVITVHGLPRSPVQGSGAVSKVYSLYNRLLGRRVLGWAAVVTGISESIVDELEAMGMPREKMVMIHNGIDLSRACDVKAPGVLEKFGLVPNEYVLAIGALHQRKGFHVLVRSFAALKAGDGLKLVIMGNDAGYGQALEVLVQELGIRDRVVFTGFMDDEEKAMLISSSRILAIPSLVEPFGLVALEGLCGAACLVVSSADGLKEIIRPGLDGEVFPPGDEGALRSAMQKVLDDPALTRKYRENGPIRVKDFDLKAIGDRYQEVYRQVLSRRRGK